jgi:hypothetical protein
MQNPDLGVLTPRPPIEERSAAPQTPLHKGLICVKRSALRITSVRGIDLWVEE